MIYWIVKLFCSRSYALHLARGNALVSFNKVKDDLTKVSSDVEEAITATQLELEKIQHELKDLSSLKAANAKTLAKLDELLS